MEYQENFTTVSVAGLTDIEIQELRKKSIGGSDASIVLGLNPYKSSYELWGEKCGTYTPQKIETERTFFGKYLEDKLRDFYCHYDVDFQNTVGNFNSGYCLRTIKKPDYIAYSKENPFISASLDGIIMDDPRCDKEGPGILEIKTMSSWMFDQYETGVPPYHYIQLQHYLYVTGYKWGDLIMLVDSSNFKVFRFKREQKIIDKLVEKEKEFWQYVVDAREHLANNEEHMVVEPPMDGSEATDEFLKKKYDNPINEQVVFGTDEDYDNLCLAKSWMEESEDLQLKANEIFNTIKNKMKEAGTMDFGSLGGRVTWKANKNGTRIFKLYIK